MIYFIRNITTGNIKIGFSDTPKKRLKELQTGSADKLILMKTIDGDTETEAALHTKFASCRLEGEWFRPADELLEFVKGKDHKALEGKFFHSFKDNEIKWQGYIISQPVEGYFLLQLFEWVLGEPSVQKLVHVAMMTGWDFYDSADEMNDAFERRTGKPGKWRSMQEKESKPAKS